MTDPLADLVADLSAEHADLDALVAASLGAGPPEAALDMPTPAAGWTIRDQISHLAWFDERARHAIEDPEAFRRGAELLIAGLPESMDLPLSQGRALDAAGLMSWWRAARAGLLAGAGQLSTEMRLPWYGPDMGARSFLTARLMETWAHGQDIADALGMRRAPSSRLRHVAHLGYTTRGWSFRVRGAVDDGRDVTVELSGPEGDVWTWGGDGAGGSVRGAALDFCLVVTQRRHLSDTRLEVAGESAVAWMSIAQAFAGGVGPGRQPGQFAHDEP